MIRALIIALVAISAAYLIANHERARWKTDYNALQKQEQANAKQHKKELEDAGNQHKSDMDAMAAYYSSHPFIVRMPAPSTGMHTGSAACTASSTPGGMAGEVPSGDRGLPGGVDPKTLGLLYDAYGKVFSATLIDLKEQQSVK